MKVKLIEIIFPGFIFAGIIFLANFTFSSTKHDGRVFFMIGGVLQKASQPMRTCFTRNITEEKIQ